MGGSVSVGPLGNLPTDTTSFVGRKHDVAEVKRLLSEARLVTLTGVGGVGKTRLALQTAGDLRRAFPDGVWLVELAGLQDADLLPRTMLEALGVHDDTGREQTVVLTEHLRVLQLLVVLDNCEHLVDACAELADTLLRAAPGLRLLTTSRERLGIIGEHLWQVSPLPLPDPRCPLPSGAAHRYPALTLFAERASMVEPDFAVTTANQEQVAQVCRLLGGIPFAIEQAAVRLHGLTLDCLLSRLDDSCRLPAAEQCGGLSRHQTLRAAVDWSFRLCTKAEHTLWARASVFAGSFDLHAAERVCAGDGLPVDRMLDLLVRLVDKSVLICEQHADHARFRLLEPLRQYGRDKLRALGTERAQCTRHRDYYLALAEQSEQEWFGPTQPDVFIRTRLEHANLRDALDFSLSTPEETRTGLRLAGTLWFYWAGCGALGEGRHWLDRALAVEPEPSPERAKALWVNGYVSALRGNLASAVAMLEECRSCARKVGDDAALAYATHRLGYATLISDDLDRATTLLKEARARYERLDHLNSDHLNSNVMLAGIELAIAEVLHGNRDRAVALCEDARAAGATHGGQWAYAYAIYVLALCAWTRGDFGRAEAYARDCLRIKRTFNDLLGIVLAVEMLAWNAAARGAAKRAATLLGAANQIWQSVGCRPMFGSRLFGAPHGDCETKALGLLGDRGFGAAFRHGMDFSLDEGIAHALGEQEPAEAQAEQPTPLTRREQQVADLIAGGLSNKEIAAKLVIAKRTAEGHVERILQKLGFSSRAQIATWATERRA